MTNSIINPFGLWIPQAHFARFNRIGPGRCCCKPPTPGCDKPPAWLDQSDIPAFITATIGDCSGAIVNSRWVPVYPGMEPPLLAGQKVTLQYYRCRLLGSNYRYEWLAELGECPSGESFYAEFSANFVYGTSLKYYYTFFRIVLRKDGQEYNICETRSEDIEWTEPKTVSDGVQLGATIGDEGKQPGLWCNGYDDMSVVFQICKIKDNWGAYDDGGYYFPNACSSGKGATELICSLDLADVVIFRYESSSYTYQRTALLSELTSAVALSWRYRQCGNYDKGYTCFVPIRVLNECFPTTPGACDSYNTPFYETERFELQYIWYRSADQHTSHLRIVDNNVGCVTSNWIVYTENVTPDLPDCDDYTGTFATSALGTISVNETVYCDIPS